MASVAYGLQKVFSVPVHAKGDVSASHRRSKHGTSESGAQRGSYIDLDEQLNAWQCLGRAPGRLTLAVSEEKSSILGIAAGPLSRRPSRDVSAGELDLSWIYG